MGDAARKAHVNVVVGIARSGADGLLRNEAVLLDRNGAIAGVYAKSHLWNFDRRWFTRGEAIPVFETDRGRIGIMICADGRVPEIARTLAKHGAWLIADPTAWVGIGRTYSEIRNPQVEFVLRTRARENGVAIAAADKCGSESGAVHYAGRSMIVASDGTIFSQAPADAAAFIVADLHPHTPRPKLAALTPAEVRRLRAPVKPAVARRSAGPAPRIAILGVYQSRRGNSGVASRRDALRSLRAQGADAVVDTAAKASGVATKLSELRGVRSKIIEGSAMLAPETARAAALNGADLIAWARPPRLECLMDFARTRAFENRVFVVVCSDADARDPACVIRPDGSVLASALAGTSNGFACEISVSAARDKTVVWGTDAFSDRAPAAYDLFV